MASTKRKTKAQRLTAAHASGSVVVESRSPAEFFAENKSIAGFDNPGKSLYTTIREFVENGLDAAETANVLPSLSVQVHKVANHCISDLYGKKKLAAKAARELKQAPPTPTPTATDSILDTTSSAPTAAVKVAASKKDTHFYRVTCRDNGIGMPHKGVPLMLGRVLSGTKYSLKQARGRFGLGAKMALIWAKMTSSKPLEVFTAEIGSKYITHCVLDIDLQLNEPKILVYEKLPNNGSVRPDNTDITTELFPPTDHFDTSLVLPEGWHGTHISVVIQGNWSSGGGSSYRWNIIKYMRRLAIITPYAEFLLEYRDADPSQTKYNMKVIYPRRSHICPPLPKEVCHHPSSVDLVVVEALIRQAGEQDLLRFLQKKFSCINSREAKATVEQLGHKFSEEMPVSQLKKKELQHLVEFLTSPQRKWRNPSKTILSPAGSYNLYLGITKELKPDLIVTYVESTQVYQGHPFIVEAAVSLGGKSVQAGINVYRFANRIPLIFEEKSDVISKTASEIRWGSYKINKTTDKIGVFVSIVSTKVPFKGTGKEFISDDIPPIKKAVRSALMHCCGQLRSKIARKKAAQANKDRKSSLTKYIPTVCKSIFSVLQHSVAEPSNTPLPTVMSVGTEQEEMIPDTSLLTKVEAKSLTLKLLEQTLQRHVEEFDEEAALAYIARVGRSSHQDNVQLCQLLHHLPMLSLPTTLGGSLYLLPSCVTEGYVPSKAILSSAVQDSEASASEDDIGTDHGAVHDLIDTGDNDVEYDDGEDEEEEESEGQSQQSSQQSSRRSSQREPATPRARKPTVSTTRRSQPIKSPNTLRALLQRKKMGSKLEAQKLVMSDDECELDNAKRGSDSDSSLALTPTPNSKLSAKRKTTARTSRSTATSAKRAASSSRAKKEPASPIPIDLDSASGSESEGFVSQGVSGATGGDASDPNAEAGTPRRSTRKRAKVNYLFEQQDDDDGAEEGESELGDEKQADDEGDVLSGVSRNRSARPTRAARTLGRSTRNLNLDDSDDEEGEEEEGEEEEEESSGSHEWE
eukprot:m.82729 g.82729  ORF g.82729 m.82729 type:complete len:1030 (+) comp12697_c0_seq8:104-3193(+)